MGETESIFNGKQYTHELVMPPKPNKRFMRGGKSPLVVLIPGLSSDTGQMPLRYFAEYFRKKGVPVLKLNMHDVDWRGRVAPLRMVDKAAYVVHALDKALQVPEGRIDPGRVLFISASQGKSVLSIAFKGVLERLTNPCILSLSAAPHLKYSQEALEKAAKEFYPTVKQLTMARKVAMIMDGHDDYGPDPLAEYRPDLQLHFIHSADTSLLHGKYDLFNTRSINALSGGPAAAETAGGPQDRSSADWPKISLHNWEDPKALKAMFRIARPWMLEKLKPRKR